MLGQKLQITGLLLILSLGAAPLIGIEGPVEDPKKHIEGSTDKTADQRGKVTEFKLPETYEKLKTALGKIAVRVTLKADGIDATADKPDTLEFKLEKDAQLKEMIETIEVMGVYSNKLKKCAEGRDKSAELLGSIMDNYVAYLYSAMGDDLNKPIKNFDEKVVNTFTLQIRKVLELKAKKFESSKTDFAKSDEDLTKRLNSLASILWGGEFRDTKFVEVDAKKLDATKKIVEDGDAAIKAFEAKIKPDGVGNESTCKLDGDVPGTTGATGTVGTLGSTGATGSTAVTGANGAVGAAGVSGATGDNKTVPPVDPTLGAQGAVDILGATGIVGATGALGATGDIGIVGATGFPGVVGATGILGALGVDPSVNNNQLRDALDALRLEKDQRDRDRDRDREREDELQRQLLAQQNEGNDQALKALQGALNAANRPNVSKSNEKGGDQGPQLSPSVELSKSTPPPPIQPPPPPQLPPPGGNPYAMMPPPSSPPILAGIGPTPSRFNDDPPRRSPIPVSDPATTTLLETLKQQQQMWQMMMQGRFPFMNQQGPYGPQNVNGSIGNQLATFGQSRFGVRRSTSGPRIMNSRMNGSARSGGQGSLAINPGARGPIPTRLR